MNRQTTAHDILERPAAMAGMFYPADAGLLSRTILEYLEGTPHELPTPGVPKALIVPHAGYVYSGAVAASAYDLLRLARGIVTKAVLLGPCHRVAAHGLALPRATAFQTLLGRAHVDLAAVAAIRDLPQVVESNAARTHRNMPSRCSCHSCR